MVIERVDCSGWHGQGGQEIRTREVDHEDVPGQDKTDVTKQDLT